MTFTIKNKETGVETNFDDQAGVDYFFSLGAQPSHYEVIVPVVDSAPVVEEATQEISHG
jgi:hypothetical protein